ncbi:MAG: protein kinase [Planctomycetota bacterium]
MASRAELLFGRIALQRGYLTQEQLQSALRLQGGARAGVHLGRILIEQGALSLDQVKRIIEDQKRRAGASPPAVALPPLPAAQDGRIGRLAVEMRFTTAVRVQEAMRVQAQEAARGANRKLGEILIATGALSAEQLGQILNHQGQTAIGDSLPGYRIRRKIGEGGMASVYEAIQISVNRAVALKVLHPDLARNARAANRFLKEARTLGALDHPNIVRVYDAGQHENLFYFAMEYVGGEALKSLIQRVGRLTEGETTRITVAISSALGYAHERGLIHRDVKPGNILLALDGTPKLCDLGIVQVVGGGDTSVSDKAGPVGTPFYMSPEQVRGKSVDTRADLYSLGATMYHMLVGEPPFLGATALAILDQHLHREPPPPRSRSGSVTVGMDAIVRKLLQKDSANRYPDPRTLLQDLARLEAGRRPLALEDIPVEAIPEEEALPRPPAEDPSRISRLRLRRVIR